MAANLAHHGIISHMDDQSEGFIGLELDQQKHVWTVKSGRFWRLVKGLQFVLNTNRKLTGRQVERLVGHITSVLLLRRELLCLIHCTYTFISESYDRCQPLWPSVRCELASALALLPTVRSETSLPWNPRLWCYDASPHGFGVMVSERSSDICRTIGQFKERYRWKLDEAHCP
eukprot:1195493-Amphidinium_carterae.1